MTDYKPPDENRCAFRFRDGRRCRMLLCREHPELCLHHYRRWLKEQDKRLPRLPLLGAGQLDNPQAVRRSLKRVVRELVDGRLTPEIARAVVQLGRLLLISTRRARRPRPRRSAKAAVGKQAAR